MLLILLCGVFGLGKIIVFVGWVLMIVICVIWLMVMLLLLMSDVFVWSLG